MAYREFKQTDHDYNVDEWMVVDRWRVKVKLVRVDLPRYEPGDTLRPPHGPAYIVYRVEDEVTEDMTPCQYVWCKRG